MEVASPLPFAPGQAGTKRPFACSPGHSPLHGMEASDDFDYAQQTFKRRRFNSNENMESSFQTSSASVAPSLNGSSSFFSATAVQAKSSFHTSGVSFKRGRSELNSSRTHTEEVATDLKRVVDAQAAEIEGLKSEKASLESSLVEVKTAHDKAVNENKILKKAVTIQQERQNHAASEIAAASRFKVDAEDKIKRLEQMCLTLQYHLQAQHANMPGNDFMGNPPRPPDVY